MTAIPETRYARSGDVNIAYQVLGEGPFDLVFVPGYVTHLELAWKLPGFADVLTEFASFSRLIKFDKRGTGMSDPVSGAPTLETRMDDVRAVMDAVGSRRAALFGLSEGASMSALFAATYPERTAALVLRSPVARSLWAPDYPWGRTEDEYEREIERELRVFGPREHALGTVRSLGQFDPDETEAFVDYIRYGASPGMLEALLRMNKDIDIRHVLPAASRTRRHRLFRFLELATHAAAGIEDDAHGKRSVFAGEVSYALLYIVFLQPEVLLFQPCNEPIQRVGNGHRNEDQRGVYPDIGAGRVDRSRGRGPETRHDLHPRRRRLGGTWGLIRTWSAPRCQQKETDAQRSPAKLAGRLTIAALQRTFLLISV